MKAHQVLINGRPLCTSGIGDDGVLSTIVNWCGSAGRGDDFRLSVGGLDSAAGEHLHWESPELGVGDEVTIRLVEADAVDPPAHRQPSAREGDPSRVEHLLRQAIHACREMLPPRRQSEAAVAEEVRRLLDRMLDEGANRAPRPDGPAPPAQ